MPGGDEPEIFDAQLPVYSPEALELTMGAIKEEAIKDMVKKKLVEIKDSVTGKE